MEDVLGVPYELTVDERQPFLPEQVPLDGGFASISQIRPDYVDRAALAVVMPQIRQELSLSNADYGLPVNAFLLRTVDRIGYGPAFGASAIIMVLAMALLNGAGKIEPIRPTTNDVAGSRASQKRSSDEGG